MDDTSSAIVGEAFSSHRGRPRAPSGANGLTTTRAPEPRCLPPPPPPPPPQPPFFLGCSNAIPPRRRSSTLLGIFLRASSDNAFHTCNVSEASSASTTRFSSLVVQSSPGLTRLIMRMALAICDVRIPPEARWRNDTCALAHATSCRTGQISDSAAASTGVHTESSGLLPPPR